jgi:hypothetical protein
MAATDARFPERDRSQFYKDLSGPFYGVNRPGAYEQAFNADLLAFLDS